VATLKLQKLGHAVRVAGGGREALAALERERFDLVLMDMEMPDIDGLETTALIRERERSTGGHVPVIAMTAHALEGIQERCLRGGMDGYLAKPIRDEALRDMIRSVTPAQTKPEPAAEAPREEAEPSAFDLEPVLARVGGNRAMLAELLGIFRQDSERQLTELQGALARRDGAGLRLAGHTLKGMVSFFNATAATEAAYGLELMGKAGDFEQADQKVALLARETERILAEFGRACEEALV
jgi:CheY-like chemotaxis protein/HPt (histidine-containing phosphotransfer) domain-containing protein